MSSTENELSEREQEILRLVATGASNKEIALRLFISTNTVKVHLHNIFAKLGASSRTEAAMYAVKIDLTPSTEQVKGLAQVVEKLKDGPALGEEMLATTQKESAKSLITNNWLIVRRYIFGLVLFFVILIMVGATAIYFSLSSSAPSQTPVSKTTSEQTMLPDMPTARSGLAVVVYENKIFAIAGNTATGPTGVVERFDVNSGVWETLAPSPVSVTNMGAVLIHGKIYMPGGLLLSGRPTDIFQIYDPKQDIWSKGAAMPEAIFGAAMVAYEGNLYVFGGSDGQRALSATYVYNPVENRWMKKLSMPTARYFAGAALSGDKIFVIGGNDGRSTLNVNEAFLPSIDTAEEVWEKQTPIPEGRQEMAITGIGDFIYLVGGVNEAGVGLQCTEYYPFSQLWREFDCLDSEILKQPGLAAMGTKLVILGGGTNGIPTNQQKMIQAIYTINFPYIR